MNGKSAEPRAAQGFIPVSVVVDRDDADVMQTIKQIARVGVEDLGTLVGDIDLTWNEDRGGYDAHCMVIPRRPELS